MKATQFLRDVERHIHDSGATLTSVDTQDALTIIRQAGRDAARSRANALRRARHDALTSLGLKRVKGSLGGTYYE